MKFIPTIACATLSTLSLAATAKTMSSDAPKLQRFEFPGLEARVFYNAESQIEKGSPATLAVVHVHGWGSGVGVAKEEIPLIQALRAATKPDDVPPYVISPLFPRRAILKRNKEPVDGRAIWNESWRGSLADAVAPNDDWRGGGDAVGTHLSSYDVIDSIFAALSDKSRFPNLKRVVMTGYSAGGQFVGRYAAVGKGVVREGITLEYAAIAPSTELRLDPNVSWHYGLKNRPRYSAALTFDQILGNLSRRRVWRGCGDADTDGPDKTALDVSPAAIAQGKNRYERFLNFKEYLKQFPEWERQVSFYTFKGVRHQNAVAHSSPALIAFIVGQP